MEPQERAAKIEALIAQCHSSEYEEVIDALDQLEAVVATEAVAVHSVLFLLLDSRTMVRVSAADFLQKVADIGDQIVGDALIPLLKDADDLVRANVAEALGVLEIKDSATHLVTLLSDSDYLVRICTVEALGALQDPSLLEPIKTMLHDNIELVRAYAAEAVGHTTHSDALQVLQEHLKKEDSLYVQAWILKALHDLGDTTAARELEELYFYIDAVRDVTRRFYNETKGISDNQSMSL